MTPRTKARMAVRDIEKELDQDKPFWPLIRRHAIAILKVSDTEDEKTRLAYAKQQFIVEAKS